MFKTGKPWRSAGINVVNLCLFAGERRRFFSPEFCEYEVRDVSENEREYRIRAHGLSEYDLRVMETTKFTELIFWSSLDYIYGGIDGVPIASINVDRWYKPASAYIYFILSIDPPRLHPTLTM